MPQRLMIVILLALLSAPLGARAVGQNATTAEAIQKAQREIQTQLNKKNQAAARKDFDGFWSLRTENYIWIAPDGRRKTAQELMPEMDRLFSNAESLKGVSIIERIGLRGNTAIVTIREYAVVVFRVAENKRNTLRVTTRSLETWVKQSGQWRVSQSRTLADSFVLNGKLLKRASQNRQNR